MSHWKEQQARLREFMDQFHAARDASQALPPEQQQELEDLVGAEWRAATERRGFAGDGDQ